MRPFAPAVAALCTVFALAIPAARAANAVDQKQAKQQAAADKVFDLSKLHVIDLVIPAVDLPKLVSRADERLHCTITFDGVVLKDVGVRQAGGAYHPYRVYNDKPSLSLNFNEFVKGQDLFGLEKLVLKNQIQDLSLMNEHLTYEVFRRAGLAAPLTAYAVVTINGHMNGIYLLREPINKGFLIRNFGKGNETGNLYELNDVFEFVRAPASTDLKHEKEESRKHDDIINLAAITAAVPAEFFVQAVAPVVDLDRYLTYFAVEAVTSDMDGFSFHDNNSYLYDRPKDGRFIMIPYGADEAFWASATPMTHLASPFQIPYSAFGRKVQSVPALMAKFKAEVARVSQAPIWDEAVLLERVAQVGRLLATAERKGTTAADLARFEANRRIVEDFIRSHGTTQNGKAL